MSPLETALEARGLLDLARRQAIAHHVTLEEILGRSRSAHIARARAAFWLDLRDAGLSYPAIGKLVGRDHSTVQQIISGRERAEAAE